MLVALKKDESGKFLPLSDAEISLAVTGRTAIKRESNRPESEKDLLDIIIEGIESKETGEGAV